MPDCLETRRSQRARAGSELAVLQLFRLVLLLILVSPQSLLAADWYRPYRSGVRLVERGLSQDLTPDDGLWQRAIDALKIAIEADARSSAQKPTEGVFREPYYPFYYLGLAYFQAYDRNDPEKRNYPNLAAQNFEVARRHRELPPRLSAQAVQYLCFIGLLRGSEPDSGNPEDSSYGRRNNRCEGSVDPPVSPFEINRSKRDVLRIVSLLKGGFPGLSGREIAVRAKPLPQTSGVRLHAAGLRRAKGYYMDAYWEPPGPLIWETNLLREFGILASHDLGVLAWQEPKEGGTRILLPVFFEDPSSGETRAPLRVKVIPEKELSQLYVTLIGPDQTLLVNGLELGFGYYPANDPILVELPEPDQAGLFEIELGAVLRAGGSSVLSFRFYWPLNAE